MTKLLQVLLVEDDDPLRDVLMEVLARRGWLVHAVAEPERALSVARAEPVDFSLLDLHLPGGTGLELLLRIREEIRPMPSILMSGAATHVEVERAQSMGVFDFLPKPLQLTQLERTLDQLIRTYFGKGSGKRTNTPERPANPLDPRGPDSPPHPRA